MGAKLKFDVVTGANVYLNDNSQFGRAMEVTGLDVKKVQTDHECIGLFGKKKTTKGLDHIELTVKWDFIHEDIELFGPSLDLTFRGNVERRDNGVIRNLPAVIEATVDLDSNNLMGTLKGQDWSGQEMKLTCSYVRIEHDGDEILEIDVDNNIIKEHGTDKLADMRKNAGLE